MQQTDDNTAAKTEEKECGLCGMFFKVTHRNQKYCPECRENTTQKKVWMQANISQSIAVHGTGTPPVLHHHVCRQCGRDFLYPSATRDFCSRACKDRYHVETAACSQCGKNLFEEGIEISPYFRVHFCSDGCKEEYHKAHSIKCTCEYCGKDFYKYTKGTFCSQECYRKAVKEGWKGRGKSTPRQDPPTVKKRCPGCGKLFDCYLYLADSPQYCSLECRKTVEYKAKQAEEEREKQEKKKKAAKYIKENGLCSICRTPYPDCERMSSNFLLSPKGAVFSGSVVVKCPKFTKPAPKNTKPKP